MVEDIREQRPVQQPYAGQGRQGYPQQQAPQPRSAVGQPQQQIRPQAQRPVTSDIPPHKKVLHILDKRMVIPLVVIILLLVAGIAVYTYLIAPEEEVPEFETSYQREAPATGPSEQADAETGHSATDEPEQHSYCSDLVAAGEYASEDDCFMALAEENSNPEYCYGIEDEGKYDDCFFETAVALGRQDYCNEIGSFSGKGSRPECFFRIALALERVEPCFAIDFNNGEFSSNHCYIALANSTKDDSVCAYIAFGEGPYTEDACRKAAGGGDLS